MPEGLSQSEQPRRHMSWSIRPERYRLRRPHGMDNIQNSESSSLPDESSRQSLRGEMMPSDENSGPHDSKMSHRRHTQIDFSHDSSRMVWRGLSHMKRGNSNHIQMEWIHGLSHIHPDVGSLPFLKLNIFIYVFSYCQRRAVRPKTHVDGIHGYSLQKRDPTRKIWIWRKSRLVRK